MIYYANATQRNEILDLLRRNLNWELVFILSVKPLMVVIFAAIRNTTEVEMYRLNSHTFSIMGMQCFHEIIVSAACSCLYFSPFPIHSF